MEIMIDPTRPSVVRQDIVVDEMRRLWDADVKVTPTLLGDRDGYTSLTPEENTVLWRRAGDLVHTAIFSVITHKPGDELQGQVIQEEYGPLPDDVKGKIIEKLVTSAQNHARAEAALHKLSQGTLLEDLETSGLVTTPVKKVMTTLGATK